MTSEVRPGCGLLRAAVAIEGVSLLLLIFVAVPLKNLMDLPMATKVMGPIHGLAFLFFLHALTEARSARAIARHSGLRLLLGALIPFGGLLNERWLARTAQRDRPDA